MSRSIAPSRALLRSLTQSQLPTRPCQRSITTQISNSATRRPTTHQCRSKPALEQRRYKSKTVEEAKSKYRVGPFSWQAGILFVLTSAGLVWYFEQEKQRMQRKRVAEATKGMGRPKVGGTFKLVDQEGRPFSSEDMKGKHALVSRPHK